MIVHRMQPQAISTYSTQPSVPPSEETSEDRYESSGSDLRGRLTFAALSAAAGGIGYLAGMATGIPVLGPAIGGIAGAVAGASTGALAAVFLPGERVKTGAVLGAVAGGIIGSQGPSPWVTGALTVAMATAPLGGLLAVFSSIG